MASSPCSNIGVLQWASYPSGASKHKGSKVGSTGKADGTLTLVRNGRTDLPNGILPLCSMFGGFWVGSRLRGRRENLMHGRNMGRAAGKCESCTCGSTAVATVDALDAADLGDAVFDTEMRVYIEHTDCYGVVFYGNYFQFFQCALSEMYSSFNRGERASIVVAKNARYMNAAKLGDLVKVSIRPADEEGDYMDPCLQTWEVSASTGDCEYMSALITVLVHSGDDAPLLGECPAAKTLGASAWPACLGGHTAVTRISSFEPYRRPEPALQDMLCWFERARSDILGGPQALQNVSDLGILIVVARIEDLEYRPASLPCQEMASAQVAFEVRSTFEYQPRRGKLVIDERIYAVVDGKDADATCVARMLVTCVCIDAESRRIARGPAELEDMILAACGECKEA
mmetsp:Transcript_66656/g.124436  ORF Transcript_66656/g.124436 Transcript_66656/m.124436 type:complete len:400 (+) Transcript_66656:31-1230(+)